MLLMLTVSEISAGSSLNCNGVDDRCRSGWLVTYHRLMPSQQARLSQGDVEVDGDAAAVVDCFRNHSREFPEL